MKYIRENCFDLSIEEIADNLNRTEEPVRRYIDEQNLKARDSYKKGILDFQDHEEKLNEIFLNKENPHLEKLKEKIKDSI